MNILSSCRVGSGDRIAKIYKPLENTVENFPSKVEIFWIVKTVLNYTLQYKNSERFCSFLLYLEPILHYPTKRERNFLCAIFSGTTYRCLKQSAKNPARFW